MSSLKLTDLSDAQRRVLDEMLIFAMNGSEFGYVFSGVAGSGKTTILKLLDTFLRKTSITMGIASFTGKAASVMRSKGLWNAQTIHSMIYEPVIDPRTQEIIDFRLKDPEELEFDLILIDEASMLTEKLFEDLMGLEVPLILVGDKEQLKMSENFCVMEAYDYHLEEIFRQDEASDIIKLSKHIRETGRWGSGYNPNEVLFVKKNDVNKEFIQKHNPDIIVTGTNAKRKEMNRLYRAAMGHIDETPSIGERIMCLKNHQTSDRLGTVFNGEIYQVSNLIFDDTFRGVKTFSIKVPGKQSTLEVQVEDDCWIMEQNTQEGRLQGYIPFSYGYAATCHKLQGSEFDTVLLFDEDVSYFTSQKAYRYTGVTRAAKKVIIAI